MATIPERIIKDPNVLLEIAKGFGGLSFPENEVPQEQEQVDAIVSKIDELFKPYYTKIVSEDAEVLAKEQELISLKEQKLAEVSDLTIKSVK